MPRRPNHILIFHIIVIANYTRSRLGFIGASRTLSFARSPNRAIVAKHFPLLLPFPYAPQAVYSLTFWRSFCFPNVPLLTPPDHLHISCEGTAIGLSFRPIILI